MTNIQTQTVDFRSVLNAQLAVNRRDLQEFTDIVSFLTKYDGKPLNGRIKLPEGWKLEIRAGMWYIRVVASDNSHLVSYNGIIDVSKIDNFDSCYSAGARERIVKLESLLNDGEKCRQMENLFYKLADTFRLFCSFAKELENSKFESYNNPAYYEMLRACGVPSTLLSAIRFDKLENIRY